MCKETKLLEVHVDKGMKHGQKITFSGEADQAPGVEPGDIVLVLQEKEHEVKKNSLDSDLDFLVVTFYQGKLIIFSRCFHNCQTCKPINTFSDLYQNQDFRREGSDLHMVQRIGLVEALCGFQMTVTHLDGRQLLVKYPPGKIIEPGEHVFITLYLI